MSLREIIEDGDSILRKKARIVENFDDRLHKILDDMTDTVIREDGVGLAAPQIGVLRKIVVVLNGEEFLEMINPSIIEQSGSQTGLEGCLSVPELQADVIRPNRIVVKYQDRYANEYTKEYTDFTARVCCHEIDHLDGVLFYDKMEQSTKKIIPLRKKKR